MSDWIPLDPDKVSKATTETRREGGVQITVGLSPYDIPQAVRGRYDPASDRFVIEFSYISEEPLVAHAHDDVVVLHVGKNSGRIYGIDINVKAARSKNVGFRISLPKIVNRAIDNELVNQARTRNYEIAKDVISNRRKTLFGDLVEV
jgi:hypothetical protein